LTAAPASTANATLQPPRAARVATWIYFGLNGFAVGMWVVHIPNVEHATNISHSTLGLLLLVLGAAAFLGMQIAGPLADRIGQRRLVPAAGVFLGLSLFGPGLATNWWSLGLTLMLFGFGNGSLDVAMNSHAVVVERAYPRPIMAAFHAMWSIGGAFAALIGAAALKADVNTAVTLSACGVVCIAVSLLAARYLIEAPRETAGEGEAELSGGARGEGGEQVESGESAEKSRRKPPARLVWQLGALAFGLMLAEGVANDWAALQFRDVLDTSASTAAYAYGAFAIAMTVGRFATDRVAALIGPAAIVRYGAALAAIGLTTVILVPSVPVGLIGWALFGLGLSGGVPQLFTAAGNLDHRASGALMAKVVGLGYVGLLAGPAIIGGLTHWMPLNVAFALPVILCILTVLFANVLNPTT
jgi:MFS family permease